MLDTCNDNMLLLMYRNTCFVHVSREIIERSKVKSQRAITYQTLGKNDFGDVVPTSSDNASQLPFFSSYTLCPEHAPGLTCCNVAKTDLQNCFSVRKV